MHPVPPGEEGHVPTVAAIIVTFNSEAVIAACLDSLAGGAGEGRALEVVVVDNASSDGSIAVARNHAVEPTIVAMAENAGYAAGINAGVAAVGDVDYVLVLNDDTRVGDGAIEALVDAVSDRGVGIAVPKLVDGAGRLLNSQRREPSIGRVFGEALLGGDRAGRFPWLGEVVHDEAAYRDARTVSWASGCAWLITRSCWNSVGPWDESLFLYGEDVDYALRSGDAGFGVRFTPHAEVTHLVGPSHDDARLWTMSVWNRYRVYRRRHGAFASGLFRLGLILNEGLRAVAGRRVHRAALAALIDPRRLPDEMRAGT